MAVTINRVKHRKKEDEAGSKTQLEDKALADFEGVFSENWERLCSILSNLLNDPSEAEDIALEAFWRLYHQPPNHAHNLRGWLYRVATNLGLNALRSRKRRQRYEEEAYHQSGEYLSHNSPSQESERLEDKVRVRQVLSRMNRRSAQILILRYSGWSYSEIAASLGVSPASIGTLLSRAEQEFEKRYRQLEGRDV